MGGTLIKSGRDLKSQENEKMSYEINEEKLQ